MTELENNISSVDKEVLQTNVSKFLDLQNQIKAKQKDIKILRELKKNLEVQIIKFMTDKNIPQLDFNGEKLKLQTRFSKKNINDKWLESKFESLMTDAGDEVIGYDAAIKDIFDKIKSEMSNRETKKSQVLKYQSS
jgi:hypothetical protein|tara:strand:- start:9520 stop:9927 length:408 start_codon:yes stop_codon:yes gene_type:complete